MLTAVPQYQAQDVANAEMVAMAKSEGSAAKEDMIEAVVLGASAVLVASFSLLRTGGRDDGDHMKAG